MVDLAAVLDISALRADLNDGERTLAGNLVERLERIPLAGERECLLLVGEQHVDVAVGQLVQKTEVLVYDVEAGQIGRATVRPQALASRTARPISSWSWTR